MDPLQGCNVQVARTNFGFLSDNMGKGVMVVLGAHSAFTGLQLFTTAWLLAAFAQTLALFPVIVLDPNLWRRKIRADGQDAHDVRLAGNHVVVSSLP